MRLINGNRSCSANRSIKDSRRWCLLPKSRRSRKSSFSPHARFVAALVRVPLRLRVRHALQISTFASDSPKYPLPVGSLGALRGPYAIFFAHSPPFVLRFAFSPTLPSSPFSSLLDTESATLVDCQVKPVVNEFSGPWGPNKRAQPTNS